MTNVVQLDKWRKPQSGPYEPVEKKRGPQVEDGYTRIADELLGALCTADFTAREFRVVHFIIKQTYGWNRKSHRMSASFIAGGTGLHATDASKVLNALISRKVIIRHGGSRSPISLNKHFEQWESSKNSQKEAPMKRPDLGQDDLAKSGQDAQTKIDSSYIDNSEPNGSVPTASAEGDSAPAKTKPVKPALPDCPHEAILDQWAEAMPDKRQPVRSMWRDSQRAKHLASRWKQGFTIKHEATGKPLYSSASDGIAWWGRFFAFLRKSEFLMNDEHRWFDLTWVCKRENFTKIMEMNYHEGLR